MTAAQAAVLTALGFVWVPAGAQPATGLAACLGPCKAAWEAQLARLVAYKAAHGDCNVRQGCAEDPRLANWVNNQRSHKRKLDKCKPSEGMTAVRVTS
jgi:hypothetical protein